MCDVLGGQKLRVEDLVVALRQMREKDDVSEEENYGADEWEQDT